MNPRIEKLKAERDKTAGKLEILSERLKKQNEQITKLENTDIVGIVRENGVSPERLAELMELVNENPIVSVPENTEEGRENA